MAGQRPRHGEEEIAMRAKQTAPVKVQADRWPLTDPDGTTVATIIVIAPFDGKPSELQLAKMLLDGAKALGKLN